MSHPTPPAKTSAAHNAATDTIKPSNFLRQIIENDLENGTYAQRRWAGSPGDAAHHAAGAPDPAKIRTRFPPEPNGYLHVGHAKSICLNFGLARDYGGVCHMRFDDTNPEKEDTEYVNSILDAVQWLGFDWNAHGVSHLYQASDYFDFMYRAAEYLIEAGHAYVDEQTPEQCAPTGATLASPAWTAPSAPAPRPRIWNVSGRWRKDSMMMALWFCAPKSTWPAPTSTCATRPSTASAAPPPQHRRQMVHLPDVHLCPPD
jgi:glutaminyl-tRNA synthetase